MGVRMIMADDGGTAAARGAMGTEQHCRIELETMARFGRDIGGGEDGHDMPEGAIAQQKPAAFKTARGLRLGADRVDQRR